MSKSIILALLSGVAFSSMNLITPAKAADLEPIVEEMPAYDWSGIYIGAHGGYGGIDASGFFSDGSDEFDLEFDPDGILGGGQIGLNGQIGSLVLGVEADISALDWEDSFLQVDPTPDIDDIEPSEILHELDLDVLATVRARLGWAVDNWLFYATGGLAYLAGRYDFKDPEEPDDTDISAWGGVVGGGIEVGLTPNVSAKLEGLYLFFDEKESLVFFDEEGIQVNGDSDYVELEDGFVARAGVNIRLNLF